MSQTTEQSEVTRLVLSLRDGSGTAAEKLLPLVYDELRRLAASYYATWQPGATLQPTALVHDAYLKMVGSTQPWEGRSHFFAVAAKAMRQILIDHARHQRVADRAARERITVDEAVTPIDGREIDLIALDDALGELARFDPRQAQLVELRFFGGLTIEETADVMKLSPATLKLDWRMARAFLKRKLESVN
jgi:RNA polymerase sigma factor (TIGR02999 family)